MGRPGDKKKARRLKTPGGKPFCCHTSRHPLREEKRGAASRPRQNLTKAKQPIKLTVTFFVLSFYKSRLERRCLMVFPDKSA